MYTENSWGKLYPTNFHSGTITINILPALEKTASSLFSNHSQPKLSTIRVHSATVVFSVSQCADMHELVHMALIIIRTLLKHEISKFRVIWFPGGQARGALKCARPQYTVLHKTLGIDRMARRYIIFLRYDIAMVCR